MTLPSPFRLALARGRTALWRFHSLPYAERVFAGVAPGTELARPFAGGRLHLDVGRTNTEQLLYLEGERAIGEWPLLAPLLAPGQRVVDAGANLGYYALLFARAVGRSGRIDAFEPEPRNFALLTRTLTASDVPQVVPHEMALGAVAGTVRVAAEINGKISADGTQEVRVDRLDALLSAADGRVDLLKIDVDGYEGHVLRGAREILESDRPSLFIELHPELVPPEHRVDLLIDELAQKYPEIELWAPRRPEGGLAKVAERYGLARPFRRLSPREIATRREPFWAIARRPQNFPGMRA